MVTFWESEAAIRAFAGDDISVRNITTSTRISYSNWSHAPYITRCTTGERHKEFRVLSANAYRTVGEPLSRERSGDNSEELLLHRGGRYSGSVEKFIRTMKGAAISLRAAREPRAHQKQRNIFLCLHRMPSLMRGLE